MTNLENTVNTIKTLMNSEMVKEAAENYNNETKELRRLELVILANKIKEVLTIDELRLLRKEVYKSYLVPDKVIPKSYK